MDIHLWFVIVEVKVRSSQGVQAQLWALIRTISLVQRGQASRRLHLLRTCDFDDAGPSETSLLDTGIGKNLGWLGFLLGGFDLDRVFGNDAFLDRKVEQSLCFAQQLRENPILEKRV